MWQPSKLTPEQIEELWLEGRRLLREGDLSQAEIARRLGDSLQVSPAGDAKLSSERILRTASRTKHMLAFYQ